ncbi:hypothetical protein L6Q85_09795 [bacterium]|nr:hypothetical protein [bacterium]
MSVFKRGTYLTSEKWTLNYNGMNQLTDRSLYLTDGSSTLRYKWVYTYDGAGNLKTQEYQNGSLVKQLKWFFTWNPRNQMTLAERFTGTNDTYAGKVTYRYCLSCDSVLSERIEYSPTVSTTITSWKRYEYDGLNLLRMDGRYDTAGGALDDNDPLRTLEVSTHKSGSLGALIGKRVYTHTNNDATPDSTNDYTYTYDAVGNVLAIYNANSTGRGNELYYFTQDAFGIELTTSPFSGTAWSTARTAGITEHQTGKWIDPFTGLYYIHARWYDPLVGRFVGRDSISYNTSLLKYQWRDIVSYSYCRNDPLEYVDIDGFQVRRPDCLPVNKPGNISNPIDWDPVNPDFAKAKYGNYCGAGTDLTKRCEPVTPLDACCLSHDFCWLKYGVSAGTFLDDPKLGKHKACCDAKLCDCSKHVEGKGASGTIFDPVVIGCMPNHPKCSVYRIHTYNIALQGYFRCGCNVVRKANRDDCPHSNNLNDYPDYNK